ncbi:MAG: serine protease [Bdellovibrionales bacterium]
MSRSCNTALLFLSIFILAPTLSATSAAAPSRSASPSVIYGDDNRLDYYQVGDSLWRAHADSTVALISSSKVNVRGEWAEIQTSGYGSSMGLCSNEPFFEQETAAFCSGFLVAPDVVVTAGHCVREGTGCAATRFVFGFRLEDAGDKPRRVSTDAIYSCAHLIHSVADSDGEDFAVVRLDRAVTQVAPLPLRRQGKPGVGDALTVIGHPSGLPLKIAPGAEVRQVKSEFLIANLDTYGGNSGSAVFNSHTGEVEGVLVRGEMDFVYENGCRRSKRCAEQACRGEDVTLIERVWPYLLR